MNKALLLDLYELTMAQVYFKHKRETQATFDLFIRSRHRPFYVGSGIDEALNYLADLRFVKEDIDYLRSLTLFEDDFLDYLREFKFQGEVWGIEEPEIVFAQEPLLRVSAGLIEAQIIESAVLNKINLAVTLATKAARVVLAAKNKGVYDFSLRRTQGTEASLAAAKYAYIAGARGTSNVYAGQLYTIPVAGTMAHSFVMSFDREIESFLSFSRQFPAKTILLIDTYNVKQGLAAAIKTAKFLKKKGIDLLGIRLDSGDLTREAKYIRKILDQQGLIDVSIFASGNLDEYKIEKLISEKAPIDAFGVGTNMGCSADLPFTDVIYKLVEIKDKNTNFTPTMKFSRGKITLPARKQVIRTFDKKGLMKNDCIVLDHESPGGARLMKKLMAEGRRLYKEKDIGEKRKLFKERIEKLPKTLRGSNSEHTYPVRLSRKLSALIENIKARLKNRCAPKVIFMDIDSQYDFLNKKGRLYVKNSQKILKNLGKLSRFAQKNKILIISSQDTHTKEDDEFKQFPPHCIKGKAGHKKIKSVLLSRHKTLTFKEIFSLAELKEIIAAYPQIILEKNSFNIFGNPNTVNLLETVFPDKIYVYGVVTECCVKEAVEGLQKKGFAVAVVKDAVQEISRKEKNRLFVYWRKKGVEFTTTQKVLNHSL